MQESITPAQPEIITCVSPFRATSHDIARWIPRGFDEVLGNQLMITHFQNVVLAGGYGPHTLVLGPTRTGKTATTKIHLQILVCKHTALTSIRPCGECEYCTKNILRDGQRGIESHLRSDAKFLFEKIHVLPIDCSHATESSLKELLREARDYDDGLRILYLDEVHRLGKRGLDELFLKPMEEENLTVIASSTTTRGLEPAFLNRFAVRLHTERPALDVMSVWLAHRCAEWMLTWDDSKTLIALAELSSRAPGVALHVLGWAASTPDRVVLKAMVDQHALTL